MVNGLNLGVGLFCFIVAFISFQVGVKYNANINFALGTMNGVFGIFNMWLAFS